VHAQVGRGQHGQPLYQVIWRGEGEHLAVVVDVQAGCGLSEGGTSELLGRREEARYACAFGGDVRWLVADAAEEIGEEVETGVGARRLIDRLLDGLSGEQVPDEAVLFLLGGELAGDALGGAELAVRGLLALEELLGDGGVVLGAFGLRGDGQGGELAVGLAFGVFG